MLNKSVSGLRSLHYHQLDDGTLYNVHRHFFERHAPRFAELYLRGEQQDILEIHDVSSIDFQRFLSIIYPTCLLVRVRLLLI